jgi:hypothetical protein
LALNQDELNVECEHGRSLFLIARAGPSAKKYISFLIAGAGPNVKKYISL